MWLKRGAAVVLMTGSLGGALAAPAMAQQSGLVNVEITRVLNNNQVQVAVPVQAAANICGVTVAALTALPVGSMTACAAQNGNQTVTATRLP